jgi:phenylalanyl-tRNA synthetase beta chain
MELQNPLSSEKSVLRNRLWPNLLNVILRNRDEDNVAVFELGMVFKPSQRTLPDQPWHLAGAVAGANPEAAFRKVKGVVELLLKNFGIDHEWRETKQEGFDIKMHAYAGQDRLGGIGLLSAAKARKVDREAAAVFKLDFDLLVAKAKTDFKVLPLPKFPPIKFDIAVVVDEKIKAEEVYQQVSRSAGQYLEELELFDVFHGKPLSAGKKSLAYHIVLRSPDATLTDDERVKAESAIKQGLRKIGGEIRA